MSAYNDSYMHGCYTCELYEACPYRWDVDECRESQDAPDQDWLAEWNELNHDLAVAWQVDRQGER